MLKRFQRLSYGCLAVLCASVLLPVAAQAQRIDTAAITFNSVSPESAPLGAFITLSGQNFGEAQGRSYVIVGGRPVTALNWTQVSITVLLNPTAIVSTPMALDTVYKVQVVKVTGQGLPSQLTLTKSPEKDLLITSAPTPPYVSIPEGPALYSVSTDPFCAGAGQTLIGNNFGASAGTVTLSVPFKNSQGNLFYQEFTLPVTSWSNTTISVTMAVPAGAELGAYVITVHAKDGHQVSKVITRIC